MTVYREFRYYSPIDDAEMIRLSVADDHGQEFFMRLPAEPRKGWADRRVDGRVEGAVMPGRRSEALDNIEAAIAQGCDPGEVRVVSGE